MSTDVQTISASGFLTFITATRPLTAGSITSTPTQQTQSTISHSSSSTTAPNALSEGSSSKPSASTIGFIVLAIVLVISFGVIAALFWIRRRKKRHVRMSVDLLAEGKMRSAESFEIVLPFNASTPLSNGGTFEQQMNRRDDGDVVMSFSDVRSPPRDHSDGVDSLPRSKSDHEYPSSTNRSDESSFTPIPTHPVSHDRLYSNSSDPSIYSAEAETSTIFKNASTVSLLGIRHPTARREADGGVHLAGGPVRESWFVNGGTLPPAYGEFR
ncbi:hypothetical protein QCA50_007201 [Cerrena zonata]|uniref:Uncharacterized protein n=1 Tax=Cerrena zonata TaxID=2478898 RepID=A0AAW0GI31_9APHY